MQVDLKNAVAQLSSRTNLEVVCCEAVMNSFHANASEVRIECHELDTAELELDYENKSKLFKLVISDNGDGFNEDNIESFLKLYSTHKESIGCKGIGRLSYLKVFHSVFIESVSKETSVECYFDYSISRKSFKKLSASNIVGNGTTITYTQPRCKKGQDGIPLHFRKVCDGVKKEIMPHLYLSKKSLKVTFTHLKGGKQMDEIVITSKDLPRLIAVPFTIQEHVSNAKEKFPFELSYVITENANSQQKDSMEGYFCANRRSVYSFSDNRIGDSKITLKSIKGYKILFLVQAKYLNNPEIVDASRQQFEIDPSYNEIDSPVSWEMINRELLPIVEEILLEHFPDLKEKAEKMIEEVKSNNLHLASYIELPNKIGGIYPPKYYIDQAEAKFKRDKEDFQKNKDTWRPEKVIRKASDLAGKELIEYVQMRDNVITQLENLDSDQALEDQVHNLIVDMKKIANANESFTLENNNLWLIDDKFMGFSDVASDVEINKIIGEVIDANYNADNSQRRPDIAAFFRDKERTKLVLFELKKINSGTFDPSKGIDQLGLYASKFRDAGVEEIYLYLVSDIDSDGIVVLENRDFRKIFSKEGQYLFGVVGKIPCAVAVLNARAIISDARARNQTFFNLVEGCSK